MADLNGGTSGDNRQESRARSIIALVNGQGHLIHPYVKLRIIPSIEVGPMTAVHGIVVHQTGGKNLESAISSGRPGIGAHFYVDTDGTVYQAASIFKKCSHVGKLKPRCLAEHRCKPDAAKALQKMVALGKSSSVSPMEYEKEFPDRYPGNNDSIGIELVGYHHPEQNVPYPVYDAVTERQKMILKWLVRTICSVCKVNSAEIYRHPVLSWENPTEALTAEW